MSVASNAALLSNKMESSPKIVKRPDFSEKPGFLKSEPNSPKPMNRTVFVESISPKTLKNPSVVKLTESPKTHRSSDFAARLAGASQTPKLTPKNTQNLTQLKIAPELNNGKASHSSLSPGTARSHKSSRGSGDRKEERPLLGPSQKIVIVPLGKSEGRTQVKVTVGSTSSDSSDGKRSPPRKRAMSSGKRRPEMSSWKSAVERGVKMSPSLKSLKGPVELGKIRSNASWASFTFSDPNSARPLSDVVSVRSLASIGMGSTDGKKLTIRRVPTSPTELLNLADPKT